MTNLTTFNYLSNSVRVILINDEPWFAAPDVCRALQIDLNNGTYKWLVGLAADEKAATTTHSHPQLFCGSKARAMTIISESGLYKLIMRSDKPEARQFQDWVTREVLPSIRKTGELQEEQCMPCYRKSENKVRVRLDAHIRAASAGLQTA